MSDYFLGEIRLFSFNFAPKYWAVCNGATLGVAQNQALFALLGTQYGGDGVTTFKLPDLRGRVPVGTGNGGSLPAVTQGQIGGEETHVLTVGEMPGHLHSLSVNASVAASNNTNLPVAGNALGQSGGFGATTPPINIYNSTLSSPTPVASAMIGNTGGSGGHENRQPYLAMTYCIAISGIYPSRQ